MEKILGKELDLENDKFKVIAFDKERYEKNNKKHLYYLIKCKKCGEIFSRKKEALKDLNKLKCKNCIHNRFGKCLNTILYDIYIHYINNARSRNIQWDLNEEEFKKIITKPCIYCGELHNKKGEYYSGIDRIDSTKEYCVSNCVPCCKICNIMKNKFSKLDFLSQIKKIYLNLVESSTTISKESTSQANGDGNRELLTAA